MPDKDVFALTATERRRAADMFAGLGEDQWAVQSLCSEWTVRDVAGYLIGWAAGPPRRSSPCCVSTPVTASCHPGPVRCPR